MNLENLINRFEIQLNVLIRELQVLRQNVLEIQERLDALRQNIEDDNRPPRLPQVIGGPYRPNRSETDSDPEDYSLLTQLEQEFGIRQSPEYNSEYHLDSDIEEELIHRMENA